MSDLKQLAMVEYDQVKEEGCFAFYTKHGNYQKLWVHAGTFKMLMDSDIPWDSDKYGEITHYQKELIDAFKKEYPGVNAGKWFRDKANNISREKAMGSM